MAASSPAITSCYAVTLQRPLQQLQPVLAPKNLARRQHKARRAEDTRCQGLPRILFMQRIEFGVGRAGRTQRRGIEPGPRGGR